MCDKDTDLFPATDYHVLLQELVIVFALLNFNFEYLLGENCMCLASFTLDLMIELHT